MLHPIYDVSKSTHWNQENGPLFDGELPVRTVFPTPTKLWDFNLNSPLGVPAGPLFNSKFIGLYSDLGFDTLVYKTVRSVAREAHPNPNIVFVDTSEGVKEELVTCDQPEDIHDLTITNSYGVNSLTIPEWQADFAEAQSFMKDGQLLILSCMGTHGLERTLVEDYVFTASAAKDAGAKVVEINFSCPNLKGACAGAIFMDPIMSSEITKKVKAALGSTPLIMKIGHYKNKELLESILKANAPYVDGVAAINTIGTRVYTPEHEQALPGEGRLSSGLCGAAIKPYALETVAQISQIKQDNQFDFEILGMGGVVSPSDVDEHLAAGAKIVMSGAGAMWNPYLAAEYNKYKS